MKKTRNDALDRRSALRGALAAGVALPFLAGRAAAQSADSIRIWTFMSAEGQSPREKVFKALIDDFQAKNKVKVVVEFAALPGARDQVRGRRRPEASA